MMQSREETTQREYDEREHEKLMFDKQTAHVREVKTIEKDTKVAELTMRAEAARAGRESAERIRDKELELARLEARWLSWLRIPITVVKLPLYLLLGVAVCISVAKHKDVPDKLYSLLK